MILANSWNWISCTDKASYNTNQLIQLEYRRSFYEAFGNGLKLACPVICGKNKMWHIFVNSAVVLKSKTVVFRNLNFHYNIWSTSRQFELRMCQFWEFIYEIGDITDNYLFENNAGNCVVENVECYKSLRKHFWLLKSNV